MEIIHKRIYLHPFELMQKLHGRIISFDPKAETINVGYEAEIEGEIKKTNVIIERTNDEHISNLWSARATIFSKDGGAIELEAVREISKLLESK